MKNRNILITVGIVAVGIVLGLLILTVGGKPSMTSEDHGGEKAQHEEGETSHAEEQIVKGPHNGRLFSKGDFALELTIFEQGVEPEFRVYPYQDGKPLDPAVSQVTVTLERLGRAPQAFTFTKEKDYLKGNAVVEEPHSFKASITAQSGNKTYHFAYDQVEARVSMSDAQLKQHGVSLLTAGPARINNTLQLIGEIRLNRDRTATVVPLLTGVVTASSANAGDRVRKGELLAVISSQALADQRSELLLAQKRLALTSTTYAREKALWEGEISAEQDYLLAKNAMQEAEISVQNARQKLASLGGAGRAGDSLTRYEIRSPIDGVVVEKHLSLGEAVQGDATIFVVADLSTVWAEMTVAAQDLNTVRIGQTASIKATAFAAESGGKVSYVGALVGEQTRSAKARVVLPNPQGIWRPGLQVNVELVAGAVDVPVAVAAAALQTVRGWTVVFGRYGEYLEARPLELGRTDGKFVEITSGLNAGEVYAAANSFLIKADLEKSGASHDH